MVATAVLEAPITVGLTMADACRRLRSTLADMYDIQVDEIQIGEGQSTGEGSETVWTFPVTYPPVKIAIVTAGSVATPIY